ncbi:hypothetical protein DFJ73DRAFT_646803 [Zopfochytrium polystomum]|nr:hypothetical protein DFJ73DRAFT_646803 [Zopfochytrium polystomum]
MAEPPRARHGTTTAGAAATTRLVCDWRAQAVLVAAICQYLPPNKQFALAALFRLRRVQAHALCGIPKRASMDWENDTDLLDFRLKHTDCESLSRMYTSTAMDNAPVRTLQWWKDSGIELRYTEYSMNTLTYETDIPELQWWKDSGLELKYSHDSMDGASAVGDVAVLQWWYDSGLPLGYSDQAFENASSRGRVEVLEWWRASGLRLEYTHFAMDKASANEQAESLEWWKASGLEMRYSTGAMYWASRRTRLRSLQWWKDSGLELRCSLETLTHATDVSVLRWWRDSGLLGVSLALGESDGDWADVKRVAVEGATREGAADVVRWWEEEWVSPPPGLSE